MKFYKSLAFLLAALVAYTSAQGCRGSPRSPACTGSRSGGWPGRRCFARIMWNYDTRTRQCQPFHYWGCGGSNNRWCTREICEQRCRR
ncbi:proteinase inhibitor-like [Lucilia cuprina]|uniref:proteinase inhibitor-like n=1 Tax=Lucilia cuprina TaxID=7375 RepID=UPI001F06D117|nr:proteinase inhibitor-like [Lucilia cuprina]